MSDYDTYTYPDSSSEYTPYNNYQPISWWYMMPTSVHAFGIDYAITFVDKVTTDEVESLESAAQESIGVIKTKEQQIQLLTGVATDVLKEVVVHELLHLCDMSTADPPHQLDENDIVRLSNSLFGILRDNPLLVQWLLQKG